MTNEEYINKILERYKTMAVFESLRDIPSIPIVSKEQYDDIVVPNLIRCGAIQKDQLVVGAKYSGKCRNAEEAIWLGEQFEYQRYKFGSFFPEKINHFQDDNGADLFVPFKKID